MHVFEGQTADEVWLMAASKFEHSEGVAVSSGDDDGSRELPGTAFTIHHPRQRWVMSREPAMNPAFAIAEVVWIVSGRRDAACLNYWNPKLPSPAAAGNSIKAPMASASATTSALTSWNAHIRRSNRIRTAGKWCCKFPIRRRIFR